MESLLRQIYNGSYYQTIAQRPAMPGYQEAVDAANEAWEKVAAAFGRREQTNITDAVMGALYFEQYNDFRNGFRLGVSLMLELLDK